MTLDTETPAGDLAATATAFTPSPPLGNAAQARQRLAALEMHARVELAGCAPLLPPGGDDGDDPLAALIGWDLAR